MKISHLGSLLLAASLLGVAVPLGMILSVHAPILWFAATLHRELARHSGSFEWRRTAREAEKQKLTGRKGNIGDPGGSPTGAGSSTESQQQRNQHRDEKHGRRASTRATPVAGGGKADAADGPDALQEPLPMDEPVGEPTEAAR